MSTPMNPFNAQIRQAGNRSRMLPRLPNIGQDPTPSMSSGSPAPPSTPQPGGTPMNFGTGPTRPMSAPQSPMTAPAVQGQSFTMHPPGTPAATEQYNYEPQPDGSWRVYPPGVEAPPHTMSASLPRAASTGDYIRMGRAFSQMSQQDSGVQDAGPVQGI